MGDFPERENRPVIDQHIALADTHRLPLAADGVRSSKMSYNQPTFVVLREPRRPAGIGRPSFRHAKAAPAAVHGAQGRDGHGDGFAPVSHGRSPRGAGLRASWGRRPRWLTAPAGRE